MSNPATPLEPQISTAVVEAAARAILRAIDPVADLDTMAPGDQTSLLECAHSAISAAILADREPSRAEIERLKAELDEARAALDSYRRIDGASANLVCEQRDTARAHIVAMRKALQDIHDDCEADSPPSYGALKYACRNALSFVPQEPEISEISRLTAERDAALSSTALAEEALAKAIASIPVAMTAAVAKAVEVMRPFARRRLSTEAAVAVHEWHTLLEKQRGKNLFDRHDDNIRAARAFVDKHSPAIRNRGEEK
jgi:hypothetical protein